MLYEDLSTTRSKVTIIVIIKDLEYYTQVYLIKLFYKLAKLLA